MEAKLHPCCGLHVLSEMVPYYARRTTRLGATLLAIALSGQAVSRLLKRIDIAVSADALLRLAKQAESVAVKAPKI